MNLRFLKEDYVTLNSILVNFQGFENIWRILKISSIFYTLNFYAPDTKVKSVTPCHTALFAERSLNLPHTAILCYLDSTF